MNDCNYEIDTILKIYANITSHADQARIISTSLEMHAIKINKSIKHLFHYTPFISCKSCRLWMSCSISKEKVKIMVYGKTKYCFTSPNFNGYLKD
jgi:hypothetical protein